MLNNIKPDFLLPVKHLEKEETKRHSLKQLSCFAASEIKSDN